MRVGGGASAALQTCVFSRNEATGDTGGSAVGGPAIGLADGPAPSAVWLQGCTFEDNESPVDGDVTIETEECAVYSDVQHIPRVWSEDEGAAVAPQWLQTELRRGGGSRVTWGPPDGRAFLNEDLPTAATMREVRYIKLPMPFITSVVCCRACN